MRRLIACQCLQEDGRICQSLCRLSRRRHHPKCPSVRRSRTAVYKMHADRPTFQSVLQKDLTLKPFEQAQLSNLCPQEAEEAKTLIPRLNSPKASVHVAGTEPGPPLQFARQRRRQPSSTAQRAGGFTQVSITPPRPCCDTYPHCVPLCITCNSNAREAAGLDEAMYLAPLVRWRDTAAESIDLPLAFKPDVRQDRPCENDDHHGHSVEDLTSYGHEYTPVHS
jgi:hypothetical protein